MHPLGTMIKAACDGALDFYIIVGGTPEDRLKMGLPQMAAEEYPLLLAFQAAYHHLSKPTVLEEGFSCVLSFDTIYECRIPYSMVKRISIQNPEEDSWPSTWDDGAEVEPEPPPPDNVRPFRPRTKEKSA